MTPRRQGWSVLPLRCPACTRRVKQHAILTHGGGVRCDRCRTLYFAVLVPQVGLGWLAEVTAAELTAMRTEALSMADVIRRLGGTFPEIAA